MAGFGEYQDYDGLGLAQLVRDKEVTPLELLDAALEQTHRFNGDLNAVVHLMEDDARAAATAVSPDLPFAGVPFLLKDLVAAYAGHPMTGGARGRREHVPAADAEIVTRYKAAGLVIAGKTNTPEFGLAPVTEPELHGPTHNPWDVARSPGGSSGGSAAAVSARFVPMAHATDGGGSIRIPASACGIFGMKPTRGRTPYGPDISEEWFGLSIQHAVTRTVRDSAALLDATAGPDLGAPYAAPAIERPYLDEVGLKPRRLRVAFTAGGVLGDKVDSECAAAVESAVRLLEELGHEVSEHPIPIDRVALVEAFITLVAAATAFEIAETERLRGDEPTKEHHELVTRIIGTVGRKRSAEDLARALHVTKQSARAVATFMEQYDVFVCSTLGTEPLKIGELDPNVVERQALRLAERMPAKRVLDTLIDQLSAKLLRPIPNTPLFNMTGQPAMSVPLYWTERGLPIGVQFVGRFGDEATLFRLAGQLEAARPWKDRRPPLLG